MAVSAIEGVVKNGSIHLAENVTLPENTRVFVIVPGMRAAMPRTPSPRLVNPKDSQDFRKQVVEVPPDAKI